MAVAAVCGVVMPKDSDTLGPAIPPEGRKVLRYSSTFCTGASGTDFL